MNIFIVQEDLRSSPRIRITRRPRGVGRTATTLFRCTAAALLSLIAAGCGSVFTTSSEPSANHLGIYYFLPKTRIKIDGAPVKDSNNYAITVAQVNEPDRNYRYFLRYHGHAFSDDSYTLTVDSKGLLQTLNMEAEDKTPAIINKIADTIVSAMQAAASAGGFRVAGAPVVELPFTVIFDPQDRREYFAAKGLVEAAGFNLSVTPTPGSSETATSNYSKGVVLSGRSASQVEMQERASDGVFFHPPTTVTVKITPQNSARLLVQKTDLRIPDKNEVAVYDLRRTALVKRTSNLTFVDGNLTTATEKRPSQALAAVTIPADLAAKAASAIPSIIKIQNDNANAATNAETARINAQTALINAQSQKLKAEEALNQARAAGSSAPPVPPLSRGQPPPPENNSQNPEASPMPTVTPSQTP